MIIELIQGIEPVVFHSIVALISLIILSKSADMLVYGISNYAKKLGLGDYLIGFIVVSIGTALPELVAALNGAMMNEGSIVFGTIFGSNIFKIPLLGILLVAARKIKVKSNLGAAPILTLFIVMLPMVLVLDGYLSRGDGAVLLLAFIIYISRLWRNEGELGKMKKNVALKSIYKDSIIFIVSLTVLLVSGRFLVYSSISLSRVFGISPYLLGLVIIGIGASMPELTVQLRGVFSHHSNLAFGNVFGSMIANSALVLGLTGLIRPFQINASILWTAAIMLLTGTTLGLFFMEKEELSWKHGLMLIFLYAAYLVIEWLF